MRIVEASDRAALARLLDRTGRREPGVARTVRRIVADVRRGGDAVLRRYAMRLDGLRRGESLLFDPHAIAEGARGVPARVRDAIAFAARTIRRVADRELPRTCRVQVLPGVTVVMYRTPLSRVGCYVPGGRHALVSSLLMTAIPARVAGVRDIVVACPRPTPAVLHAARVAGVTSVLRAGGAQAVAALAYGTGSVAAVDKIVGPGNAYVAAAKALVAPDCAIDFYAGPTELVALVTRGSAEWIASDLIAQAEHDPAARVILLTSNRTLARDVSGRVRRDAPRYGAAAHAVARHGVAVVTRSIDESISVAVRLAPEHLWCDDERVARRVRSAGTIFVGPFSVPAAGDYATGSNHVLPTAGAARGRGGLSVADFMKTTTIQQITRAGLRQLAPAAVTLARTEGLEAHARSIEARL